MDLGRGTPSPVSQRSVGQRDTPLRKLTVIPGEDLALRFPRADEMMMTMNHQLGTGRPPHPAARGLWLGGGQRGRPQHGPVCIGPVLTPDEPAVGAPALRGAFGVVVLARGAARRRLRPGATGVFWLNWVAAAVVAWLAGAMFAGMNTAPPPGFGLPSPTVPRLRVVLRRRRGVCRVQRVRAPCARALHVAGGQADGNSRWPWPHGFRGGLSRRVRCGVDPFCGRPLHHPRLARRLCGLELPVQHQG